MLTQTRTDNDSMADLGEQLTALPSRLAVRVMAHAKRRDARIRNRQRVDQTRLEIADQLDLADSLA